MIAEAATAVHTWWGSPVLLALIGAIVPSITIIWQGRKTRVSAEEIGQKAQVASVSAEIAAGRAATHALAAAQVGMTAAKVGRETHDIVNGHQTKMEKLIAALRAEIASLRGHDRPSEAVLGKTQVPSDEK